MKLLKQINFLVPVVLLSFISCEGEDIPDEFFSVSGSVMVTDPEFWIDGQTIEVGLFVNAAKAEYSTPLSKPTFGETVTFEICNVPVGDYTCKVFVAENGLYRADIYNYAHQSISSDTHLQDAEIDLLSFSRVQDQVFNRCTQCHGGVETDASGSLVLLESESYTNLVNVASSNSEIKFLRVKSGDADSSLLLHVLNNEGIPFYHGSSYLATVADIELLSLWIEYGALNN